MAKTAPKATLVESISEQIRRDIMMHVLQPGEKINIKELAARYEASETPIRIALNRLVAENIIEDFPRQGMRVKPLDIESCKETFDMRCMMELYCAHDMMVAVNLDMSLKRALKENVERHLNIIQHLTENSPIEEYLENYECDAEFHEMLVKCSCNRLLLTMYRNVNPFLYTNYVYERQSQSRLLDGVQEHMKILEALEAQDEELVKQRLREHLDMARQAILMILKMSDFDRDSERSEW